MDEEPVRLLGSLCTFQAGTAFPEPYQGKSSGDFPFIKVSDMKSPRNRYLIKESNNWLNAEEAGELRARPVPEGSVVFAKIGLGLLSNRFRITTRPTLIDNNMMAAIPNESISIDELYIILSSIDMGAWAIGAALPYLTQSDLQKIPLNHISFDQLERTSETHKLILSGIDSLGETAISSERVVETLFYSWFVDFDPVKAKANGKKPHGMNGGDSALFPDSFADSPLGPIPSEWVVSCVSDLCELQRGLSYNGKGLCEEEEGFPMVNLASHQEGGGYKKSGLKFYSGPYEDKHLLNKDDVLVATVDLTPELRVVGSPLLLPSELDRCSIFSQDLIRLRIRDHETMSRGYLYQWLKMRRGVLAQWSTGSTVSRFPPNALERLQVLVPPKRVMERFTHEFEFQRDISEVNERKSAALAMVANSLVPRMRSGELNAEIS